MSLRRVAGATEWPVTLAEAKMNLRVDHDTEDALIESLIMAATAYAERYCGTAFAEATWELVLDAFPTSEIELPLGPVSEVVSVSYIDGDGVGQAVDAEDYVIDLASRDAWIVPVDGWPTSMEVVNAIVVRFEVGAVCPDDAKHAINLMVGHWFLHRETASAEDIRPIPMGATALLDLHRRIFV